MKRKTNKLLLLLLSCILLVALAACGNGGNGGGETNAGKASEKPGNATGTEKPSAPPEEVTLNVLTQSVEPKELIAKFNEEYPHITINWEQVDTANVSQTMKTRIAAGGEKLDIMTPQRTDFVPMAESGVFLDLKGADFLSSYEEAAVASGTVGDQVVGVPLTQQAYLVWYNKDIFEKMQLSEPRNWEEFLAVSAALKAGGVAPIALPGKEEWVVNVFAGLSYSGLFSDTPDWLDKAAAGEVKWTDAGSVEALEKVKLLVDKGYLLSGALGTGYDQAYQAFYQGQAAMMVNGAWSIDLIIQNEPPFEVGAFVPPGNAAGQDLKVAFTPGNTISIAATTKYPEEAKLFLSFLSQPENASIFVTALKQFSSVKGASSDFHPATELLKPIFATEKSGMLHANLTPTTNSVIGKELQKIIAGETTPEKAAQAIQDAQDKDL